MLKILLTSDLHIGSEADNSPVPENIRLKTFKKLVYLARSHDMFLIAGDLFHNKGINNRNLDFVADEFNKLRAGGIEIIYAHGDHEAGEEIALANLNISKVFSGLEDENILSYRFVKDGQEVFIYGLSVNSRHSISEIKKISGTGFHIGLFHADFYINEHEEKASGNDSSNRAYSGVTPVNGSLINGSLINGSLIQVVGKDDIVLSGLDFYAMGHSHQFRLFKAGGKYIGAYPGSPESVSFDETGDRYAISFMVSGNEICQIKRLTVNSAKVETAIHDCTGKDFNAIISLLDGKKGAGAILKLQLTGERNFKIDPLEIENIKAGYLGLYIEDKTSPTINMFTDEFAGEDSLRGEFFSILAKKIKDKELPGCVDTKALSEILNKVVNSGSCTVEDLCNYWNA